MRSAEAVEVADEIRSAPEANTFPPIAQYRYRTLFEEPTLDEGFAEVRAIPFERRRPESATRRALLLDMDGTVRKTRTGRPFPVHPDEVELLPNRREVLARYLESGYLLLGISNQSGVAAGTLTEEQAIACFDRTVELLGVPIDVRFCPHPSGAVTCWCRKPMPGMAVQLIEEYDLDPAQCVMVGDMETDRECAAAAGLRYEDAAGFFAPPAGSGIDH